MKKVLSTALILGALYGTANAAPITSPIYLPEAGKILSTLNIGYTSSTFDKAPAAASDKLEEAINIEAEGKLGIMEKLSLNYGLNLDFSRKLEDQDQSAKFTNFYVGVTGRVLDVDAHKLDIIFNVGQEEAPILPVDQVYAELAVRYGLDFDMYNMGFSIGGKYINDWETNDGLDKDTLERGFAFYAKLENEFTITEKFTIGFDLFYNMNDKIELKSVTDIEKYDSYSEYGFDLDANYAVYDNNFIGLYFNMTMSDFEGPEELVGEKFKDPMEYKFGLRYTSLF